MTTFALAKHRGLCQPQRMLPITHCPPLKLLSSLYGSVQLSWWSCLLIFAPRDPFRTVISFYLQPAWLFVPRGRLASTPRAARKPFKRMEADADLPPCQQAAKGDPPESRLPLPSWRNDKLRNCPLVPKSPRM